MQAWSGFDSDSLKEFILWSIITRPVRCLVVSRQPVSRIDRGESLELECHVCLITCASVSNIACRLVLAHCRIAMDFVRDL